MRRRPSRLPGIEGPIENSARRAIDRDGRHHPALEVCGLSVSSRAFRASVGEGEQSSGRQLRFRSRQFLDLGFKSAHVVHDVLQRRRRKGKSNEGDELQHFLRDESLF